MKGSGEGGWSRAGRKKGPTVRHGGRLAEWGDGRRVGGRKGSRVGTHPSSLVARVLR